MAAQQQAAQKETIGSMTRQELETIISTVFHQEMKSAAYHPYHQTSDQPLEVLLKAIRESIWTPPPGAKQAAAAQAEGVTLKPLTDFAKFVEPDASS